MDSYRDPHTREQALAEAFYLRLIAPGEREAEGAAWLALELAAGLEPSTVEQCKARALERFDAEGALSGVAEVLDNASENPEDRRRRRTAD